MPELPEVETIVRKLQAVLPGKTVSKLEILHPKTFMGNPELIVGKKITQVSRRAKIIRIHFTHKLNLIIHLKMTGQVIYVDGSKRIGGGHPTPDWVNALPSKHTRAVFQFKTGEKLFFNDQRLFGWIKVVSDEEVAGVFKDLAPDVNTPDFTAEYLALKLKNRSQNIKKLLMDTSIVSGIGNIYVCDALNVAQVNPFKSAKTLTPKEIEKIVAATKQVVEEGIAMGGTTFDGMYVDIEGLAGEYQSQVRVYGREGKHCLNCQGVIVKSQLGGRGTYYCSVCQLSD